MRIDSPVWRRAGSGSAFLLVLVLGLALAPSAASAAGRVALVVGNSAYAEIGTLPNPGNDAADMAAALGRLGFDVTTVRDADRAGLNEALRLFARDSAGADVSLVFYAGHGLEMDGVNYLVPVDARLERDTDVEYEALPLDRVLRATTGAGLRVVILDACRNNPLARSMQRTRASRSVSRGSFGELNEDLLGAETLVAYAAAAGTTAADGTGRNSPYTSALLAHLEQPLELSALFRRVRAQVLEATAGDQRPLFAGDDRYFGIQAVPADVNGDYVVDFVVPHRDDGPDDEWGSEDDFTTLETLLNTTPAGPVRCSPRVTAVGTLPARTLYVGTAAVVVSVADAFQNAVTYQASSSVPSVATVSVSGSDVTVTAVAEGSTTITVTASGADNLIATQQFKATATAFTSAPVRRSRSSL